MALTDDIRKAHRQPYAGASIDNSIAQERLGYPKALAVLRTWPLDRLLREHRKLKHAAYSAIFGGTAKKQLRLFSQVIMERRDIEAEEAN